MMWNLFGTGFRHYLRRLSRDPVSLLLFVAIPVVIIFLLGYVYSQNSAEEEIYVAGYNMVTTYLSVAMMLLFQLNAGIYLLNVFYHDLMRPMKWRLKASPCPTYTLIFSGSAACFIFAVLQGVLVVACTALFLDAYWGNLWITLLVILFVSIIAMLLSMILLLYSRSINMAEYISWGIAWVMAVLGGMIFSLPDNAFFRFMLQYGTPFSLAQTAIGQSGFLGTSLSDMWVSLGALAGIAAVLAAIVIVLGRRKLT